MDALITTLSEAGVSVFSLIQYQRDRDDRAGLASEPYRTTRAEKIEKDAVALRAFAASLGVPGETQMTVRAWAAFSALLDHKEAENVTAEVVPMMLLIPLSSTPQDEIHANTPADAEGAGGVGGGLVS